MKKILLFIFLVLISIFSVNSATLVNYSYSTGNDSANAADWRAQTFNINYAYNISSVGLNITVPVGIYSVSITATNASANPTSPYYCTTTLGNASINASLMSQFHFNSTCPQFNASTLYAIVFRSSAGTWRFGYLGNDYANGTARFSTNSGATWSSSGAIDYSFYILSPQVTTPLITINTPLNNTYYNTSTINLNVSANAILNLSYSLNNASNVSMCLNCNSSTNYTISPINGTNKINIYGVNTSGVSLNTNSTFYVDVSNPSLNISLPFEYNNYTGFNFSRYINYSDNLGVSSCTITISGENSTTCNNTNYNFSTNGNKSISITLIDLAGNSNSSLNNIMLINPYAFFYFSNGSTLLDNFTFGGASISGYYANFTLYNSYLTLGSNSLLFEKTGYASTYVNFTVNTISIINLTTNVTQSKIIVNIYDRVAGSLITPSNTTIILIGTYGYNTTTTTGQVNISNINFINETYTIIASNPNYYSEVAYFDYANRAEFSVNLYLINTSLANYGVVTIQLITSNGQRVNDALCSLQEWKPAISGYLTVAQGQTNINGEYQFNIEVGNKFYKIYCEKAGQSATSNSQIFTASGLTIPLQIGDFVSTPSMFLNGVSGNISYNNVTELVTFTFIDTNGLNDIFCLKVYNVTGINHPLVSSQCNTTSSGSFYTFISNNQTNNVQAIGTVTIDGITYTLDSVTVSGNNSLEKVLRGYNLDIILPLVLMLLGLVIGLVLKPVNIFISIFLSIVGVWLGTALVPSIISSTIAIFITLIGILMIWGGYKPK